MIKVKWRVSTETLFEYWTNIPEDNIKKYMGPFYPHNNMTIRFRIVDPIPMDLQESLGKEQEIYFLKMSEHFYLIEDNIILLYSPNFPVALLRKENITHYKIGNNSWVSIENVTFNDQFCIVSLNPNAFSIVGGQYPFITFMDDTEIETNGLVEKSFLELTQLIEISNYHFTPYN